MKKLFLLFLLFSTSILSAQKGTTHISFLSGGSSTTCLYGLTTFNASNYDKSLYPLDGGRSLGGYNFGLSTTYFFHENLGLSLDWNRPVHKLWLAPIVNGLEEFWGSNFKSYTPSVDKWNHNIITIGPVAALPMLDDKLIVDVKVQVGFNAYTVPFNRELIRLNSGSTDNYISGGESYTTFATNFGLGAKYYFGNFGIGFQLNELTAYTSGNSTEVTNIFNNVLRTYTTESEYVNNYNITMLNYVVTFNYRIGN